MSPFPLSSSFAYQDPSFFSINITWTATAKELTESGFRVGLDRIVKDFKYMYLFLLPLVGGMIYLALYAPRGWLISDFAAIVPLANQVGCHALLPVRISQHIFINDANRYIPAVCPGVVLVFSRHLCSHHTDLQIFRITCNL